MFWFILYLIIALIDAVAFLLKSIFEITSDERKALSIDDWGGAIIVCITIGLIWPISWPLWRNED